MKPILHIINNPDDAQAIETIRIQGKDSAYGVAAVFTGEVPQTLPSMPDVRICALQKCGDKGVEIIGYEDLLNLIFSVETISVW